MIRFSLVVPSPKQFSSDKKQKPHKSKKASREANVHILCISFTLSQNSLSDKQTVEHGQHTDKPALSLR